MDIGLPYLRRTPVYPRAERGGTVMAEIQTGPGPFWKGIFERSAFRTWAVAVGGLLVSGLTGEMTWKAVGTSVAVATISAALALFFGSDSIGVTPDTKKE